MAKNLPVPSSRSWREHGFGGEGLKPHLWLGRSLGKPLCGAPPDMTQVLKSINVGQRRVAGSFFNWLELTRKLEVLCLLQQEFDVGEVLREDRTPGPHEV